MATVPITISNVTITHADGSTESGGTITGEAAFCGGPVDPGQPIPPDPPTGGQPIFPIWGPPGSNFPDVPGYPPVAGHPLPPIVIDPPPQNPPPMWLPVFVPGYGWIAIPAFPHPTPSAAAGSKPGGKKYGA